MFDFQKLDVYQKSKSFCISITKLMSSGNFDSVTNDQLRRASFSIMLNIAEGSSRFSNKMLFSLIQHLERKWRKRSLSNILSLILTN
ncbi:MAG TPA: four helix bundle protein [Bacteroidales bacterium]|nr:four helix bundle protein [Bacteroidales bacterium]